MLCYLLGLYTVVSGCAENNPQNTPKLLHKYIDEEGHTIIVYEIEANTIGIANRKIDFLDSSNSLLQSNYAVVHPGRDSFYHGLEEGYYKNGVVHKKGYWDHGRRIGTWFRYDGQGNIISVLKYILLNDTTESANQAIFIKSDGDTNRETSSYYNCYDNMVNGSIKNGQEYELKVKLDGHLLGLNNAYISVGNYNEKFRLEDSASCDTIQMKDFNASIKRKEYRIGLNTIRGVIVNHEDAKPGKVLEHKVTYFSHDFNVIN